jgi:diacylglycerol kinase family enzyme
VNRNVIGLIAQRFEYNAILAHPVGTCTVMARAAGIPDKVKRRVQVVRFRAVKSVE